VNKFSATKSLEGVVYVVWTSDLNSAFRLKGGTCDVSEGGESYSSSTLLAGIHVIMLLWMGMPYDIIAMVR